MDTLKLVLEYNGSRFFGWQKQEGKRTVQGALEEAFFLLIAQKIEVVGSGRTDKGVHAIAQVASVSLDVKMPLKNMRLALNNLLPSDIVIKQIIKVDSNFNARFSAKRKTYRYLVSTSSLRSALNFDRVAYYGFKVDIAKMQLCSKLLIGKHNFSAFASADAQVKNFEREIFNISIEKKGNFFRFDITGNGFLYNMVRIIVGTLLDVGRGKISCKDVEKALQTGQRSLTGITMPANGLYLLKVEYA